MKKSIFKVPNGKLLKIFVEDDGAIKSIKITGDFFTYPEENIEKLEDYLRGAAVSQEALRGKISQFLAANPTTFFGLDAESLISTILNAQ